VFKLLQALAAELKIHMQSVFDEYLDIAALGTIADVMPLTGENRILVKNGLNRMAYTENRGLRALIRQAEIDPRHITTGTVGFTLAPRINAAGRVGDPKCAVSLLLAEEDKEAEECARRLNEANRERQVTEQHIFEEAIAMLTGDKSFAADKVLVLAKSGWHHGIIGIVASKITERFHKPCILISLDQDMGKGSGRSIRHFNLFAALSACEEHLVKFGGHELAAGLTVCSDRVEAFRRAINAYAASVMQPEDAVPEIIIDAELPLSYMNLNTVDKFSVMAPYGMGNASPVFVCRGLRVTGMRLLSEGKHIRLNLSDGHCAAGAIGFSMGELAEELHPNDRVDIVFNLESNLYRGERQVQILLKDLRPSPPEHAIS
ncbi:MAG: DHH family phosphoesterase, partial [Clostridia bacterium]